MLAERAYYGRTLDEIVTGPVTGRVEHSSYMSCVICPHDDTLCLAVMQTLYGAYGVTP